MRDILFRGKRVGNGKWVEGYFIRQYGSNEIVTADDEQYHIFPNTIGQFTGLTDKNGTRIFEGDIIKITDFLTTETAIAAVKYGSPSEQSTSWGWYFEGNDGHAYFLMSKMFCEDYNAIIIGNIYDNPELLKGDCENDD